MHRVRRLNNVLIIISRVIIRSMIGARMIVYLMAVRDESDYNVVDVQLNYVVIYVICLYENCCFYYLYYDINASWNSIVELLRNQINNFLSL